MITSTPRGPAGVAASPGPAAGAPSPPARPAPAGPVCAGRRRSSNQFDDGANVNDWMSCHVLIAPVARLRSSTRRGGCAAFAPRPCAGAGSVPGAGVCGGVAGGVGVGVGVGVIVGVGVGTGVVPGAFGAPGAPPARPRPPRPPAPGSTVYAIHFESAEKSAPDASATSIFWLDCRFIRCSTGLASAGTVFVSDTP